MGTEYFNIHGIRYPVFNFENLGGNFTILTGPENFTKWEQDFICIANHFGVWDVFINNNYVWPVWDPSKIPNQIAHLNASEAHVAKNNRIKSAKALLARYTAPAIRARCAHLLPFEAWNLLNSEYKMPPDLAQKFAINRMKALHLGQCDNLAEFIYQIRERHEIMVKIGVPKDMLGDSVMNIKLLDNLGKKYQQLIGSNAKYEELRQKRFSESCAHLLVREAEIQVMECNLDRGKWPGPPTKNKNSRASWLDL